MLKVGQLVPITIVKALPHYDSYLALIAGTDLLALLPKKYASRVFRVGDTTLAALFTMAGNRITLSQRSPQYLRKLLELILAPLLREEKIRIRRAAMVSGSRFAKVAVEGLQGEDPIKECLHYLRGAKQYTDTTITLVRYSDDMKEYIVHALSPAPAEMVRKVIHLRSSKEADVYVDPAYVGLFLGKGGANVSSAAKLTGVAINIKTGMLSFADSQQ